MGICQGVPVTCQVIPHDLSHTKPAKRQPELFPQSCDAKAFP